MTLWNQQLVDQVPVRAAVVSSRAVFPFVFISFILFSYCYVGSRRNANSDRMRLRLSLKDESGNKTFGIVKAHSQPRRTQLVKNETFFFHWPHDPDCNGYFVQLAPNHTFPPRALVSFPGSGNSWLRYLIEAGSGYFTGSIFHDQRLYDAGLRGEFREPNDGSTIIQKTHHDAIYNGTHERIEGFVRLSEILFGYRGVLLVRNPYKAVAAYWNFIKTKTHQGVTERPNANTTGWNHFVRSGFEKWATLIKSWVTQSPDLLIVLYEDLKSNPVEELVKILQYLERPIDDKRLECVRKYAEGPFHRTQKSKLAENTRTTNAGTVDNETAGNQSGELDLELNAELQEYIADVNRFLESAYIPLRLNYTGSVL